MKLHASQNEFEIKFLSFVFYLQAKFQIQAMVI
jgi:hypothetical protein